MATVEQLKKKYTSYRDNIQWHIDTNKPEGSELEILKKRVSDYNELLSDLNSLDEQTLEATGNYTCQCCGNRYKIDIIIPDNLWEKISPTPVDGFKTGGLLCGKCIMIKLEQLVKEPDAFNLSSPPSSVVPVSPEVEADDFKYPSYEQSGGDKKWDEMSELEQAYYDLRKVLNALTVSRNTIKRLREKSAPISTVSPLGVQEIAEKLYPDIVNDDNKYPTYDSYIRAVQRRESEKEGFVAGCTYAAPSLPVSIVEQSIKKFNPTSLYKGAQFISWLKKLPSQPTGSIQILVDTLNWFINKSEDVGREGCTYGDTQYDSMSAAYGYNTCLLQIKEDAAKALASFTEGIQPDKEEQSISKDWSHVYEVAGHWPIEEFKRQMTQQYTLIKKP